MGALPRGLLAGICAAVLLATVIAHGADAEPETASMVVGLVKCADCATKNMKAEAVFNGLQVAVRCKNAAGVFVTKALGEIDKSGAFSVPLAADLLREDGELKQDCFAQLHSAANQPCPGQEPSWIVRPATSEYDEDKTKKIFVPVAGKVHYPSKECASAFLCFYFHKHLFYKTKPAVPVYHSPVPEYKPPHPTPTPIYYSPAEQKTQNPKTDPEKFKKLLPFIKKNPVFPKFPKFPPGGEKYKPPHPTPTHISYSPAEQETQDPKTDPEKFKKLLPFIKRSPFFPKFPKFPPGGEEIKA